MEFTLDFSPLLELGSRNPFEIMWILFVRGGWVVVGLAGIQLWWTLRQYRLEDKYRSRFEHVLLAIDVPKASEQTPKAMELVFSTITGAHQDITKRSKFTEGETQLTFSFEIISIDGFVQFLVHTPKVFRDLIEGSIYSQYPDAEITEVEDYTKEIPTYYPNDQYNIWGSEIFLSDNEAHPIRTYKSFEDQISQEMKDPLASMIETMSRIQKGEQVWLQIILEPTENAQWVKRHMKYALKLAGKKVPQNGGGTWSWLLGWLYNLPDWFPLFRVESAENKKDSLDFRVMNLTPGERASVEGIEMKASKLGYICKIRFIYVAPIEKYSTARVVNSVFGSIKQFGDLTSNSLKPNKRTKTSATWFWPDHRKNLRRSRIMQNYKLRSRFRGSKSFILNVEELASLYHFPSITVKSPFLKRTEVKKSDSPTQLPTYVDESSEPLDLREQLVNLDLDNDYFEERYAKDPARRVPRNVAENKTPPTDHVPRNLPIA